VADRKSVRRAAGLGGIIVLAAALLSACTTAAPPVTPAPAASHRVEGKLNLDTGTGTSPGAPCVASEGFDDVHEGAQVTVRNENGTLIEGATLSSGVSAGEGICTFSFELLVPDAEFYSFELGDRGEVVHSFAEMEAMAWRVAMRLGS
jgi:hypothetical protein